jgi:hypothetical protein
MWAEPGSPRLAPCQLRPKLFFSQIFNHRHYLFLISGKLSEALLLQKFTLIVFLEFRQKPHNITTDQSQKRRDRNPVRYIILHKKTPYQYDKEPVINVMREITQKT